jgi:hypothetical protein
VHRILLAFYPSSFRAEFGEEMQTVFADAVAGAEPCSWSHSILLFARELRDLPGSLLKAYAAGRRLGGSLAMNNVTITSSTRWQAFLGMLPFVSFGIASMIGKVAHVSSLRGYDAEMVVYALALAGLLIGWIRGFPLWSYSYLGWSLVLAWANTNMRVDGTNWWGCRFWIPFGATVLIALLWTRSLQPVKKFLRDVWRDWTRLSLALYALGGWVSMIYDENHHPYLLVFMLASTLVTAGTAWFFLRSSSIRGRILAIVGGFMITIIISSICYATWDWHEYHGIAKQPTTWYRQVWNRIMLLFFWGIFLLWPFIAESIRRKTTHRSG